MREKEKGVISRQYWHYSKQRVRTSLWRQVGPLTSWPSARPLVAMQSKSVRNAPHVQSSLRFHLSGRVSLAGCLSRWMNSLSLVCIFVWASMFSVHRWLITGCMLSLVWSVNVWHAIATSRTRLGLSPRLLSGYWLIVNRLFQAWCLKPTWWLCDGFKAGICIDNLKHLFLDPMAPSENQAISRLSDLSESSYIG